jgi:hypothetical protein
VDAQSLMGALGGRILLSALLKSNIRFAVACVAEQTCLFALVVGPASWESSLSSGGNGEHGGCATENESRENLVPR